VTVVVLMPAENALLPAAVTDLHLLVAETTPLARMIDVTESAVIEKEIGTLTTVDALVAQSIVIEIGKTATDATKTVMVLPTETTEKVRSQPATTLSCPGIRADTRISCRLSSPSSR
jgi:hypothetical protein